MERDAKRNKDKADLLGQTVTNVFRIWAIQLRLASAGLYSKHLRNLSSIFSIEITIYMHVFSIYYVYVCVCIVRTQYICILVTNVLICN